MDKEELPTYVPNHPTSSSEVPDTVTTQNQLSHTYSVGRSHQDLICHFLNFFPDWYSFSLLFLLEIAGSLQGLYEGTGGNISLKLELNLAP